ncbi:MAG: hypothetical protein U5J98_11465 [Halobacteriales archaeon]|nr:hypothetical protein [Halobacteriales archaeon]
MTRTTKSAAAGAHGEGDTNWLVLKLVVHAAAAGVLGFGLLLTLVHGFVRDYLFGLTGIRPD